MSSTAREQVALEFFAELQSLFRQACQRAESEDHFFQLGHFTIRLSVAGRTLASQMTRALNHLAIAPVSNPDLTVNVWDSATSHTPLAAFPWQSSPPEEQYAAVQALNTDRIFLTFNEYGDILNAYDAATNTGLFWLRDGSRVPMHEASTPLRNLLHWFLLRHNAHFVHSGAVGLPTGGVLLAGKGGSGKSTTAVACLESALQFAADDYCMIAAEPEPHAYSLYCSAKLHAHTLPLVPHVAQAVLNQNELATEKATALLYPAQQEKLVLQFPIRAILLPRVTGGSDTKLTPATAADSIRALTLSTVSFLPRIDAATVMKLNRLIAPIPAYHLELGTDMTQIPQVILDYLSHTAR